jgi:hypothetical protein
VCLPTETNTYIVPDSENCVQPTVAADRDWLHVEARFNYEDRDTGSVWLGYNFTVGEEVTPGCEPDGGARRQRRFLIDRAWKSRWRAPQQRLPLTTGFPRGAQKFPACRAPGWRAAIVRH